MEVWKVTQFSLFRQLWSCSNKWIPLLSNLYLTDGRNVFPGRSRKLMEIYFPTLRNAPLLRSRAFSSGLWRLSDWRSVSFVISSSAVVGPPRGRIGRWHRQIRQMARENLTTNGGRSLATSRSGIDVNLRVGYNGVKRHLRRKLPPICSLLTMDGRATILIQKLPIRLILERKTGNKIQRMRMVHIATGALSLIVDICQSNKETLDKQLDTLSNLFL